MTDKTPWADVPTAMMIKVAVGKLLDAARRNEQRRIIQEALRQRVRTNTFRTEDGYTLRRQPKGEGFVWTDGDLTFEDREGSPATSMREASGTLGDALLAGEFIPDAPAPKEGASTSGKTIIPDPDDGLTWVGIYFVRREFGGPEEGGWYYDAGTLADAEVYRDIGMVPRAFLSGLDDEIDTYGLSMQDALDASPRWNAGRPSLYSVNSKGRYIVRIEEGPTLPLRFPAEVPRYE